MQAFKRIGSVATMFEAYKINGRGRDVGGWFVVGVRFCTNVSVSESVIDSLIERVRIICFYRTEDVIL